MIVLSRNAYGRSRCQAGKEADRAERDRREAAAGAAVGQATAPEEDTGERIKRGIIGAAGALGASAIGRTAISQAPAEISSKVMVGDARIEADFISAKAMAGITASNGKFDLIIDEDMICCLTDAEASTFRTLAMKYSNMFIHFIDTAPHLIQWYNWHSITEWKTNLGTSPKEKWYARFTWSEI